METKTNGPLAVIVGQTASGKTALAIELAKKYNGEIICADSRTIYKGMDIGTAKPTKQEQEEVKHHMLDLVYPDETFTVADFKDQAQACITDILSRGKLPVLVGGSGLYIDSVIYDFQFRPVNEKLRNQYDKLSIDELQLELYSRGIPLPENSQNKRYLTRALEAGGLPDVHNKLRPNTLLLGLNIDPEELKLRINKRIKTMIEAGLVDEVNELSKLYGWDLPAMQAPAYKAFRRVIDGTKTIEEAIIENEIYDNKLAKKQKTWFKRNNSIQWLDDPSKAEQIVKSFLNKVS